MGVIRTLASLILVGGIIYFGGSASNSHEQAGRLETTLPHPGDNPKYSSVANLYPGDVVENPGLADEYEKAMASYNDDVESTETVRSIFTDERDGKLIKALALIVALGLLWLPWGTWASNAFDWIKKLTKAAGNRIDGGSDGAPIIGREKMARFSVADEMIKWKKLLDDGVITQGEFDEARAKLLRRSDA